MGRRGPKSMQQLAANAVDGSPPRLKPPAGLSAKEKALFTELINGTDSRHWRPSDVPLLVSYCQASISTHKLARSSARIADWERSARVQMSLAVKLRLCPHS